MARHRLLIPGAFAGAVLAIASVGFVIGGSTNPALIELGRLESAAARGDATAATILAEYGRFAAARGVSPDVAAADGGEVSVRAGVGPLNVAARGLAPFSIRVDASADLSDAPALAAYLATRRSALATVAAASPSRTITVFVGFRSRPGLTALLDTARAFDAVPDQLLVDATIGGERRFTQVFSPESTQELVSKSNGQVLAELREAVASMQQPLCGSQADDIEWAVRSARLRLRADAALAMARDPNVLLVDPVEDVLDDLRLSAVWVTVAAWPNVTTALEGLEDRKPRDEICQEAK